MGPERGAGRPLWAPHTTEAPGFAAIAIATLALGIGANTTIFRVVNVLLLTPLPYRDSDQLVYIVQNTHGPMTSDGPVPQGSRRWMVDRGLRAVGIEHLQGETARSQGCLDLAQSVGRRLREERRRRLVAV